jgi:hypothetical protein
MDLLHLREQVRPVTRQSRVCHDTAMPPRSPRSASAMERPIGEQLAALGSLGQEVQTPERARISALPKAWP